jgi:hypothetical protein
MKRARLWLVSIALAVSAIGGTAQSSLAHTADAWSNANAFKSQCLGFTDTYPARLQSLAAGQMQLLGYAPVGGAVGASFTRSAFLGNVFYDYAVYVHSHGDNYWAATGGPNLDSGFLQDPGSGKCNNFSRDVIRSSSIKSATLGSSYNLVIMSTCMLGSNTSTMPAAFQIEKTKTSMQREFYLGYSTSTYDSAAYRFESAFWSYLNARSDHSRTLSQAFTYAVSIGGYEIPDAGNPFRPNWWGNPNYNGTPG